MVNWSGYHLESIDLVLDYIHHGSSCTVYTARDSYYCASVFGRHAVFPMRFSAQSNYTFTKDQEDTLLNKVVCPRLAPSHVPKMQLGTEKA